MRALQIAATGMAAQQTRVEVISQNLANMSTTGYNARRAEFADLAYQQVTRPGTISAADGTMVPAGVQMGLGVRPTVEDAGRVLLEVHCFDWPAALGKEGGYGKIVRVELLHKLRDEARYDGLEALQAAIHQDIADARGFFEAQRRGT